MQGKGQKFWQEKIEDILVSFLYLIAFLLIKIGDAVLFLFAQPFKIIGLFLIEIDGLLTFVLPKTYQFSQLAVNKVKRGGFFLLTKARVFWSFFSLKVNLSKKNLRAKINLAWSSFFAKIKPRYSLVSPQVFSFILGVLSAFIFFFFPYNIYLWLERLPHPQSLRADPFPATTKIYDRNGYLLYEIFTEKNRTPVLLDKVPDYLKKATIAIEDKDFYSHPGFSLKGILRAVKETYLKKNLQGGSTITQQLIKNTLLTPEVSLTRKLKEIILAFWAERLYSKDEILEMYLNQVPYGGTAWGVEAAAETYFGKKVNELSLAEAALLAGLPAAPTSYSPFGAHPELAKKRQEQVLEKMVEAGFISRGEAEEAKKAPLKIKKPKIEIKAPHFVMYVKEQLVKRYGQRMVEQGGLQVITSLELPLQEMAQEIVFNEVEKVKHLNVRNGAALVTNPKTGEVLAMVGSKDYFNLKEEGNVNVCTSLQQPGSSIKVVTYAAALQNGFTAATILNDSPVTYKIPGQPSYSPVNYDHRFHGLVPLRYALGNSYNVPAVKVLAKIGLSKMIEQGRKMGITTWEDKSRFGLSLTLGGGEVTMLDMTKVYGTLANGGIRKDLTPILKVADYKGKVLEESRPKLGFKAVSSEVAFILSDILADNSARTAAFGPSSQLVIPGKTVSVKTGTSNDLKDNWTIGYTPSFVVVVWVGNNDNSPMSRVASGVTGASPIWHQIMTQLLKEKEDEKMATPAGVIKLICRGRWEYFIKGTEPAKGCPPLPTPKLTPLPDQDLEVMSPYEKNQAYFDKILILSHEEKPRRLLTDTADYPS